MNTAALPPLHPSLEPYREDLARSGFYDTACVLGLTAERITRDLERCRQERVSPTVLRHLYERHAWRRQWAARLEEHG